jgi:Ndr family
VQFECGGMVLEEAPGKLAEAIRLFLQGLGYGMLACILILYNCCFFDNVVLVGSFFPVLLAYCDPLTLTYAIFFVMFIGG